MKIRNWLWVFSCVGILLITQNCGRSDKEWAAENAKRQCGSCHLVPEPNSLTKEIWAQSILPQMSMYFKWQSASKYDYAQNNLIAKKGILPMNDKTWASLESYYIDNGLSQVDIRENVLRKQNRFDEILVRKVCEYPSTTALLIDDNKSEIYLGCKSELKILNDELSSETLLVEDMTISDLHLNTPYELFMLDIGILSPNDYYAGSLRSFNLKERALHTKLDSLIRPVHMIDHAGSIYISEHGNERGRYSKFNLSEHGAVTLTSLPGIYKTFRMDIDHDGQDEFILQIGQAKEGIYMWRQDLPLTPLIQFPPEFGLSDMDTTDMNNDGFTDLIITNGDNADISFMHKSYHGVRILLNDKIGGFKESYFYPLCGASQVKCLDANADGLQDLVVSSFFPFNPEQSIVYLEQSSTNSEFQAYTFEHADSGRWLVMESGDIDEDGDKDIIVGSYINGPTKVADSILDSWIKESNDLLVLRNRTNELTHE